MPNQKGWTGSRTDIQTHDLREIMRAPMPTSEQVQHHFVSRRNARQRVEELRDQKYAREEQ